MSGRRMYARKALVAWLAYAFTFGPLATPAYAAIPAGVDEPGGSTQTTSRDFSDVPLPAKKRPNPNMIFSIDDSGSTDGEVSLNGNDGAAWYYTAGLTIGSNKVDGKNVPSFFGLNTQDKQETGVFNFNKSGNANGTWKKYVYLFPNGVCGANCDTRSYRDAQHDHFAISPSQQFGFFRSADFNKQYYNPTIRYEPWKPYNDGTTNCPSGTYESNGALSQCVPKDANPKAARSHPVYGSETMDLTTDVPLSKSSGRYFRLYDGMRVLPGSQYRRCEEAEDGDDCESWKTVGASELLCVGNSANALTSCKAGTPVTITGQINMSSYDHVEMAAAYFPARYYVSSQSKIVDPAAYAGFPVASGVGIDDKEMRLVEIRPGSTFPKVASRTDCAGTACTYDEEIQNFANWYQYYRKRHLSLNGAIGNAIDGVRALNGGYVLFNQNVTDDRNVRMYNFDTTDNFTQNQKRLLGFIYRTKGNGGTPTREALTDLGKLFSRNKTQQELAGPASLSITAVNVPPPITQKCTFNGGFVITDGFASSGGPTAVGDVDGQTPGQNGPIGVNQVDSTGAPIPPRDADAFYFNQRLDALSRLPDPKGSGNASPFADSYKDTLADIAMHYYTTNIRPDLPKGWVPVNYEATNPDADKNPNLHMNTFGLILGLRGTVFGVDAAKTNDPFTNVPDWNAIWGGTEPRDIQRDPRAIDELWKATINGRGVMLSADSPEETRNAVLDVVNNIQNKGGAAAAVSVSNANPVQGDNFSYQSEYNSGSWWGDLNKYEIDLVTGAVGKTKLWTVSPRVFLANVNPNDRKIATWRRDIGDGVPFRLANLSADQQAALAPGKGTVADKVEFLRGERKLEGETFRSRGQRKRADGTWVGGAPDGVGVLGDIVNAEPVIVSPPKSSYFDTGYAAFKTANKTRETIILQGANDGMVHAFRETDGSESWAYVPSFGFDKRQDGSTTPPNLNTPGLANLADKEFFIHKFFVDATPVVGDVDFSRAGSATPVGAPNWRTIAVGGLGKGGRGWYALDVTDTTALNETAAAAKVLWEFPSAGNSTHTAVAANVGYSFGKPIITKTKARGWVVIVPSGYENGNETGGNGRGALFVLNPANGDLIEKIEIDEGKLSGVTVADLSLQPLGLAHIVGYAENADVDNTVQTVYGGDLYGNVWRFDFRGAATSDWKVTRLATLSDGNPGNRQPVTSEPDLGIVNSKLVVYVGTGKYFGDRDIPDDPSRYGSATRTQSVYALMEDLTTDTPAIANLRSGDLVKQTATKTLVLNPDGTVKSGTTTITPATVGATVDPTNPGRVFSASEIFGLKRGWYLDLPDSGERIVTNPTLGVGALTFTSNTPSGADPCLPGGSSWIWTIDYRTGTQIVSGGTTYPAAGYLGLALASRPVLVKLPNGKVQGLVRKSDATTDSRSVPTPTPGVTGKRKSWREIMLMQ